MSGEENDFCEGRRSGCGILVESKDVGSGPPPLPHPGLSRPIDDGYINDSRECKGDNDNDSYL